MSEDYKETVTEVSEYVNKVTGLLLLCNDCKKTERVLSEVIGFPKLPACECGGSNSLVGLYADNVGTDIERLRSLQSVAIKRGVSILTGPQRCFDHMVDEIPVENQ